MKKLFLFCLLFIGITAFTTVKTENFVTSTDTEVLTENTNGYEIEMVSISDLVGNCCTANVYHNGEFQTSFTCCLRDSCNCAWGMACGYIEAQGGTCPFA